MSKKLCKKRFQFRSLFQHMYKQIIKPIFFLFPPEKAHYLAMNLLRLFCSVPAFQRIVKKHFHVNQPSLEREVFGLRFPNPVGLAAGFDKDARWVDQLECLGFGFIEIGTVTPLAQSGNDQPRLFRLPKDEALINRMGFNNGGAYAAAEKLKNRKTKIIIGGNIGKNKLTLNEEAVNDYIACFNTLFDVVDYFVVNVSSPNTPGLRALQEKGPLTEILTSLMKENDLRPKQKPILLKIAPDLSSFQLDDIIAIVIDTKIAGVIATNTTTDRQNLRTTTSKLVGIGNGGLSGKPLAKRSTEVIQYLVEKSNNAFPVIGVGGIHNVEDTLEKLQAGASLVQLYTSFIYEGAGVVKRICNGLATKKAND